MSNPSFSNIDQWLFEYSEGNLSDSQVEQLKLFLLLHPEFDVDRDMWDAASVKNESFEYPNKEKLKKDRPIGWIFFGGVASLAILIGIGSAIYSNVTLEQTNNKLTESSRHEVSEKLIKEIQLLRSAFLNQHQRATNGVEDYKIESSYSSVENKKSVTSSANYETTIKNVAHSDVTNVIDNMKSVKGKGESFQGFVNSEIVDLSFVPKKMELVNSAPQIRTLVEKKNTPQIGSVEYKVSLKSRLNSFSRSVQRMMDNPVALKNFRDPQFHVPGMLANDVNFSSAGTMLSTRVQTLSRLQWFGKDNEQLLNQISVDGYAFAMRGGLGVQVNHGLYKDGGINVASASLTYSPKFSISRKISVEPSLRFKMGNKSIKKDKMSGISMVEVDRGVSHEFYADGSSPIGSDLWYKDLGLGLMVNTEWFYAGVQLDNLFRYNDNIYSNDFANPNRSNYHFIANAGTDWVSRKETFSLSPYIVYQNMGAISEVWVGANTRFQWFTIGGAMSSLFDPSASVGVKFKHFSMNYNADYSLSKMTGERALSHQVTLKFVSKPSRFGKRLLNL